MKPIRRTLPILILLTCVSAASAADAYYKRDRLFSLRPSAEVSLTTIDRFGPVGMSLELLQPAFTVRIKAIEEGSPAAATGRLKPGQMIESINGEKLQDIDPRIQLGNMITRAEASDGEVRLAIRGGVGEKFKGHPHKT